MATASSLGAVVVSARRRANRFVAFDALTCALVPATAVVAAWQIAAQLGAPGPGIVASVVIGALTLVGAALLFRRGRLDDPGAALLLDRRAHLDERCVTGLRTGGAVEADALARLDEVDLPKALAFRPPPLSLAAAIGVLAVAGLALAGSENSRAPDSGGPRSAVVLSGGGGGGDGESTDPSDAPDSVDPTPDLPDLPEGVNAVEIELERAEARLGPEDAAAIEEIRKALAAGDDDAARAALERLLEKLDADPGEIGPGGRGAARHVEDALAQLPPRGLKAGESAVLIEWDAADRDLIRRFRRALRTAGK